MALPNPWTVPTVTIPTAAQCLGWSRATAYRRAAAGALPVIAGGRVSTFVLYQLIGAPLPPRPIMPMVR